MMGEYGWYGPGFGWMFMMLVWVLVIVGVVALIKWLSWSPTQRGETPLAILKARYARGEVSKEEYERMRHELQE
jgi:putative membrane protein